MILYVEIVNLKFKIMADKNKTSGIKHEKENTDNDVIKAHNQAEEDIENDPDLKEDDTDDLDEGELARLEGED
jgi:hypothetical protein